MCCNSMAASSSILRKPAANTSRANASSSMPARHWTRACPRSKASDKNPVLQGFNQKPTQRGMGYIGSGRVRGRLMKVTRPDSPAAVLPQSALVERYERVRRMSLALAAPLTDEDCQVQSMPDASPTKWHLAHVTWFFETFVLERFEAGFVPFDASFRVLFNSYYHRIGDRHPRPQRGLITRPTLAEVKRYRANVDERMAAVLAAHADDGALDELVTLGLHHEQQHQELILTDIKHLLSFNPTHAPYARRWPIGAVQPQPLTWHRVDGGLVHIGHDDARD